MRRPLTSLLIVIVCSLRTTLASVVGEKYNVRKCASCTDNDRYEYVDNKCRHTGEPPKSNHGYKPCGNVVDMVFRVYLRDGLAA
jgi:hypothetical protein